MLLLSTKEKKCQYNKCQYNKYKEEFTDDVQKEQNAYKVKRLQRIKE